jgi:hypothetical protein
MAVTVTNRIEQLSTGSTLTPQFLYQSRSIGIVWMIAHQHVSIFHCKAAAEHDHCNAAAGAAFVSWLNRGLLKLGTPEEC